MKKIAGCFTKIGESKNGVIVGTIGKLTIPTYEEILEIAKFYNINTTPGVFWLSSYNQRWSREI